MFIKKLDVQDQYWLGKLLNKFHLVYHIFGHRKRTGPFKGNDFLLSFHVGTVA